MTESNRLHRSSRNSMLFGVAGGMAEYFDIDPVLVRIAWVLFILASGGVALIAYVVLALIIPRAGSDSTEPSEVIQENIGSLPDEAKQSFSRTDESHNSNRRSLLAIILITLGLLILIGNFGLFSWWRWDIFWPLVLVAIGAAILIRQMTRRN